MRLEFSTREVSRSGRADLLSASIKKIGKELHDVENPLSFIVYAREPERVQKIKETLWPLQNGLKTLFIVGIGGANLGSKALYEALNLSRSTGPETIFIDNLQSLPQPFLQEKIDSLNSKKEFALCIISKSGETTETLVNAEILLSALETKFSGDGGSFLERIVVITKRDSPLWELFLNKASSLFEIPEAISDRFSVFSPVGVVPLLLMGFEVEKFVAGARDVAEICLRAGSENNPAVLAAKELDYYKDLGKDILDLFYFASSLETLGKWHRQLFAESVGKEFAITGEKARSTYTPIVSIGTTDLHSMLQLNLAQPEKRFTQFVYCEVGDGLKLRDSKILGALDNRFVGKSQQEILGVIYTSVKASYDHHNLPYFEVVLPRIDERALGEYMFWAMITVVLLGELWNVNVFNQPNVEEYKERAKNLLS